MVANKAARAALAPGIEDARKAALASEELKPYRVNSQKRGYSLETVPVEIGLYASSPLVACENCRMKMSYTFTCLCRNPYPVVVLSSNFFPPLLQQEAKDAWERVFNLVLSLYSFDGGEE